MASVRKRRRILDYASDSSSNDEDPPCLRNTARDLEFFESDYESVDSEEDDPLKWVKSTVKSFLYTYLYLNPFQARRRLHTRWGSASIGNETDQVAEPVPGTDYTFAARAEAASS